MEDIVPDVVDSVPKGRLQVMYGGNLFVEQGNALTPTQVKDEPKVTWESDEGQERDTLLTLLMVDPDAPSRADPEFREILHWAMVNIPGDDPCRGYALAEYIGAGPPLNTGLHRYVFLLYRQREKIEQTATIPKTIRKGRLNFSARDFASKHRLGSPIAANYFQAQYDDYVPIRNKLFTG
ncbi:GL24219 [Drosophila persimilis]|uniref:GL24219 n=1 Tax=Drosophila persimilis TaxID=7234 RepID=B4G4P5_DROPE|nr:protein D3 [Drosophila persimilis]EDW24561.1 GL24219 [Drosophila persimilis]